jgi:hypothetical protein
MPELHELIVGECTMLEINTHLGQIDVIFESEWNHVLCTLSGLQNKLFIDEIGIRVFKQGINMEDIRFTNPHLLKDKYKSVFNRVFHRQPHLCIVTILTYETGN